MTLQILPCLDLNTREPLRNVAEKHFHRLHSPRELQRTSYLRELIRKGSISSTGHEEMVLLLWRKPGRQRE